MQTPHLNLENKMKRITLITLAVAGLSFAAAPSYAQSSYGGNTGDSYGNTDRAAAKALSIHETDKLPFRNCATR